MQKHFFRPALLFFVFSSPSLGLVGTPSHSSGCSVCSDWFSSVMGSVVKVEQVVELG